MSTLIENLRIAFVGLVTNKLRTALTMLGIIIGVAAVVILLSLGQGVQGYITEQFESLGVNLINVFATRNENGYVESFTLEDAEALRDTSRAPAISLVMPVAQGNYTVVREGENFDVGIQGVTTDFLAMNSREVTNGVFFSQAQEDYSERVAVLGVTTVENLFGTEDPIGETIRIGKVLFEVIGVLDYTGGNDDDVIIIPLSTLHSRLDGERTLKGKYPVDGLQIQALDDDHIDAAVEQTERILREERGLSADGEEDNFRVMTLTVILDTLTELIGTFTLFLGVIAGISLVVGGIGVMNIMLVTVNERTREIGLRKAVGAQNLDIVLQFLIEAMTITLTGGTIGVVIAAIVALLATLLIADFTVTLQITSITLALAISASIGIFFGVYPARRASKLDPIDALRYE